jgi:hypothetical protein
MLYWSLMFLFVALSVGVLVIACTAGARKILTGPHPHTRSDWATYFPRWLRRLRVRALAGARKIRSVRWRRAVLNHVIYATAIMAALVSIGFYHVYFDRSDCLT